MFWSDVRKLLRAFEGFLAEAASFLDRNLPVDPPGPPPPATPVVVHKREVFKTMSTGPSPAQIGYTLAAPAATAPDVVSYVARVTIGSAAPAETDYPIGDAPAEVVASLGDHVDIAFAERDAAGNTSAFGPALAFVCVDDVPPSAPGAPTVVSHREVFAPPAPTPPPVPPAPPVTPPEPPAP